MRGLLSPAWQARIARICSAVKGMSSCVIGTGTLRSLAENLWVWRGRPVTTSPLHVIVVILQDGWKKGSKSLKTNIHTDLGCPNSDVSTVCAVRCRGRAGYRNPSEGGWGLGHRDKHRDRDVMRRCNDVVDVRERSLSVCGLSSPVMYTGY